MGNDKNAVFIEKARAVHGDKYDYSKVDYINNHTNVCIICPKHGEFLQIPNNHLNGYGCHICGTENRKLKREDVIERFIAVHGDRYDYSKVEYVNFHTKVCIICPKHGEFWQSPSEHFRGRGCPECGKNRKSVFFRKDVDVFIEQANKIHSNKYDYSKVEYVNTHTKVCIICPKHGEFWQTPNSHLRGRGCPECYNESRIITTDDIINDAKKTHGERYDYSKTEYKSMRDKICVICHKKDKDGNEHGEFWQMPLQHIYGQGCPKCKKSKLEIEMNLFLERNGIKFIPQYSQKWLKRLRLDFYLPDYNIGIECQGGQHFSPCSIFGGEKTFKKIVERDLRKKQLCEENGVKLLYYTNVKIPDDFTLYHVETDIDKLLSEIKSGE